MTSLGERSIIFIRHLYRTRSTNQPSQPSRKPLRPWVRVASSLLMGFALGLSSPGFAEPYKAPRGPDGIHPDLNGIWQALNSAHYNLESHVAGASVEVRDGPHGPVPSQATLAMGSLAAIPPGLGVVVGGKIPYLEGAAAKRAENQANWAKLDPEVKCYLPGIPRATYMPYPFQILQSKDSVFMAYQYAGATREVYMEDPGEAPLDSWMGWSYGRWDGDTLVIEVTGLGDQTWFDRSGNYHSDQLKVTERYTPSSAFHLTYEATIEDPAVYSEPWTIKMPLYRRMEENASLMEFKCAEFVEELLYGQWRRNPLPRPDFTVQPSSTDP